MGGRKAESSSDHARAAVHRYYDAGLSDELFDLQCHFTAAASHIDDLFPGFRVQKSEHGRGEFF